jgi:hypothetical protein
MAVGDVQQADVAEGLQRIVQALGISRARRIDRQSGYRCGDQPLQEFAPLHHRTPATRGDGSPRCRIRLTG